MLNLLKKASHLVRGKAAEDEALMFLMARGLKLVCRNYRCKQGELDLVMTDDKTLVIVEVRYRNSVSHGSALESVTSTKQARIIATTQHFLATQHRDCPLRFDVIAQTGSGEMQWIRNAF